MKDARGSIANVVILAWLYWRVLAEQTCIAMSSGFVMLDQGPGHDLGSGLWGNGRLLPLGTSTRVRLP
jgi:hypothetical protein